MIRISVRGTSLQDIAAKLKETAEKLLADVASTKVADTSAPKIADTSAPKIADTSAPKVAKKKAAAAKEEETPAPSTQAAAPAAALTVDDMRAKIQAVSEKKGMKAVITLLAKHGAKKISDVDPSKYSQLEAECAELTA